MEQACICALQAAHVYVGEMHMITFTFADFSCSGQFHGVPSHVCAQLAAACILAMMSSAF